MKKLLVLGSQGQLGQQIQRQSKYLNEKWHLCLSQRGDFDLANINSISTFIKESKPEAVLNCIAYTAVDKAESEKETANKVNGEFVRDLANILVENSIPMIHISTDFVFDGKSSIPYKEDDLTKPLSAYGTSKRLGEYYFQKSQANGVILRTSWLYSRYSQNFMKTILRVARQRDQIKVVSDQVGSPTYARDLANFILLNIDQFSEFKAEMFHFSNEGLASWYDFAASIVEYSGLKSKVYSIETKEYHTDALRPAYSVLNKLKLKKVFKYEIPNWRSSLKECIDEGISEL